MGLNSPGSKPNYNRQICNIQIFFFVVRTLHCKLDCPKRALNTDLKKYKYLLPKLKLHQKSGQRTQRKTETSLVDPRIGIQHK